MLREVGKKRTRGNSEKSKVIWVRSSEEHRERRTTVGEGKEN